MNALNVQILPPKKDIQQIPAKKEMPSSDSFEKMVHKNGVPEKENVSYKKTEFEKSNPARDAKKITSFELKETEAIEEPLTQEEALQAALVSGELIPADQFFQDINNTSQIQDMDLSVENVNSFVWTASSQNAESPVSVTDYSPVSYDVLETKSKGMFEKLIEDAQDIIPEDVSFDLSESDIEYLASIGSQEMVSENNLENVVTAKNNSAEIIQPVEVSSESVFLQEDGVLASNTQINKQEEKTDYFKLEVEEGGHKEEISSVFDRVFTVTDERSAEDKLTQFKEGAGLDNKAESSSENEINLSMTMTETARENIMSLNNQSASATGSTFQEMLSQQIQNNAPDFVKAGNIVLRDNNNGTINMNLRPEALGNVKISLELSDKVITGHITVHSKEAFEAFKQNLDNLKQAFQESGFENATLNLSFADNSSNNFGNESNFRGSDEFFSKQAYGELASSDVESVSEENVTAYDTSSDRQISIVA